MNMIPPLETDSTTAILLPRERRARTSLILHQPYFMPLSSFAGLRPAETIDSRAGGLALRWFSLRLFFLIRVVIKSFPIGFLCLLSLNLIESFCPIREIGFFWWKLRCWSMGGRRSMNWERDRGFHFNRESYRWSHWDGNKWDSSQCDTRTLGLSALMRWIFKGRWFRCSTSLKWLIR